MFMNVVCRIPDHQVLKIGASRHITEIILEGSDGTVRSWGIELKNVRARLVAWVCWCDI